MNELSLNERIELLHFIEQGEGIAKHYMPFIGAENLGKLLEKEYGFEPFQYSGDNTNGYSVDFWYYYKHKEHGFFCLSGSLLYGDVIFTRTDEDSTDEEGYN